MSFAPAESQKGAAIITESTTLTLQPLTVNALKGASTVFTGKLSNSTGTGIAGKKIHLFVNDVDTPDEATTDASGNYSITHVWTASGTFNYQVKYAGD